MANMLQSAGRQYATAFDGDPVRGQTAALKKVWQLTWREAQTQTYADAFLMIAACFGVATAMGLLMRNVAPPKPPSTEAH